MKICHGGHTHTLSTAEEIFLLVFEDKLGTLIGRYENELSHEKSLFTTIKQIAVVW